MFMSVLDLKALPKGLQKSKKKEILYLHKGIMVLNYFYNLFSFY